MAAQIGDTESVDTPVRDGKTMRGSIDQIAAGTARFITQVSLNSNILGLATFQNTSATNVGDEIAASHQLLDRVEVNGLLVQAEAPACNTPFLLYLDQRGANFQIVVKYNGRRGSQEIKEQLKCDLNCVVPPRCSAAYKGM